MSQLQKIKSRYAALSCLLFFILGIAMGNQMQPKEQSTSLATSLGSIYLPIKKSWKKYIVTDHFRFLHGYDPIGKPCLIPELPLKVIRTQSFDLIEVKSKDLFDLHKIIEIISRRKPPKVVPTSSNNFHRCANNPRIHYDN